MRKIITYMLTAVLCLQTTSVFAAEDIEDQKPEQVIQQEQSGEEEPDVSMEEKIENDSEQSACVEENCMEERLTHEEEQAGEAKDQIEDIEQQANTVEEQVSNDNHQGAGEQVNILFEKSTDIEDIKNAAKECGAEIVKYDVLDYGTLCVFEGEDTEEMISTAEDIAEVETAEENILLTPLGVTYTDKIVNDEYTKLQWNFETMQVENAWDVTKKYRKKKIRVGLIDSGCNKVTDLEKNVRFDLFQDATEDNATTPTDGSGHGTEVASIIAATPNNQTGIAGIGTGWDNNILEIIPYKTESEGTITVNAFEVAMNKAVKDGCKIINISLGVPIDCPGIKKAVNAASAKGILIVAATGNNGGSHITYPAAYDNVLAVGSIDNANKKANDSNYGEGLFLTAPGVLIPIVGKDEETYIGSGTSYAAPEVTATAAMVMSVDPSLNAKAVTDILKNSATDIYAKGYDETSGWGVVNAWKAVQLAAKDTSTPARPSAQDFTVKRDGSKITISHNSELPLDAEIRYNSTTININDLPMQYTYTLPKEGTYTIAVRSKKDGRFNRLTGKYHYIYSSYKNKDITWKKTDLSKADVNISGVSKKIYTGSNIKQKPVVKIGNKTLTENTDYTVSYKNNKNIGEASVVITGKGNYKGKAIKTFIIGPENTSFFSVTGGKRAVTVKWKKQTNQTTGYQIQYSTSSTFRPEYTNMFVPKNTTTSKTISSLVAKKKYYVRIRTYKTVNNKKYYSKWSASQTVTTK